MIPHGGTARDVGARQGHFVIGSFVVRIKSTSRDERTDKREPCEQVIQD